ncbi:hypothetical protein AWB76_05693 [Caballeronia temeraria]|uniref:Phage membrane protein n=1 Tax=Caballeronia temeraria TaxID=1777137 RepID=A0A158CL46_9BURK|nr:hypothetical protein [Caballeronia temeraria]SAK83022.1 hypothetical protein AWB76_05693 [Caballeronia temeraria]
MSYEDVIHDGQSQQVVSRYSYGELRDLTKEELFACIFAEVVCEQTGIEDVAGVLAIMNGQPKLSTRGKFSGATPGTSRISRVARAFLNYKIKGIRLPMLTGRNIFELRLSWTSHLGAFVGRAAPIAGWAITTYDLVMIGAKSIMRYNRHVKSEDQVNDATLGTFG